MWAARYWAARYWAARYWAKLGPPASTHPVGWIVQHGPHAVGMMRYGSFAGREAGANLSDYIPTYRRRRR